MAETFSPIVIIPPATRQAVYAARRKEWTDAVGQQIGRWLKRRITDQDAVAAHMKAMQGGMPE